MSDKLRELREREHLCTYQILNNSIFKKIIHFTASFSHENAVILEFEFNLKVLGIVNLAPRSYRVTLTEVCNYLTVIIDHCCCHLCYHFYHYYRHHHYLCYCHCHYQCYYYYYYDYY